MEAQTQGADVFDALAPISFDDIPVGEDYAEYVPPIGMPDESEAFVKPELTARELIEALIKGMPGQKKTVYHVIDFCREERSVGELLDEIAAFEKNTVSVYAPETICANMTRAKALTLVGALEPSEEDSSDNSDAEYLQAVPNTDFGYISTPEALAVLEEDDPAQRLADLIDEDAKYEPVYTLLLESCSQENGMSKKEVDALIDNHPLCLTPRVYSGRFVRKLEAVDALEFDGRWHTAPAGMELLEAFGFDVSSER